MSQCADCGKNITIGAVRCASDNAKMLARKQAVEAAIRLADSDREILQMRADGLSGARIAARLNISAVRAYGKVRDARRRESIRQSLAAT